MIKILFFSVIIKLIYFKTHIIDILLKEDLFKS